VPAEYLGVDREGTDERGDAEDEADVGDVRADDGPEAEGGRVARTREHRDEQFGSGRGEGDDGDADDGRTEADTERESDGPANERLGAEIEAGDAGENEHGVAHLVREHTLSITSV
jgi:hypothetical protein